MKLEMLKSKIHRARITDANINYVGSITIDETLMKAVDIVENERVYVYNINNGERFDTYVIKGEKDSGEICINGAAARLVQIDDIIIIVAYCILEQNELASFKPKIIVVDEHNKIIQNPK